MSATPRCRFGHPQTRRGDGRMRCKTCERQRYAKRHERRDRHPRETLLTVPNAPLRERFQEMSALGRCNAATLAAALGWMRPPSSAASETHTGPQPDTTRVLRTLGLVDAWDATGSRRREKIAYEVATRMLGPLEMDPYEAGV